MAIAETRGSGAFAHERLRRAIVRLELPPGSAVSEQQLGDRFDLSKAAVRAALARLRAEGLVLAEPRRGHVVAPITLRDVGEVYALRLLLEPPAAAGAAGRLEPAALERLRATVRTRVDVEDAASIDRFLDANRAVHVAVAARRATAGSPRSWSACSTTPSARSASRCARAPPAAGCGCATSTRRCSTRSPPRTRAAAERIMRAAIERFRDELLATLAGSAAVQDAAL